METNKLTYLDVLNETIEFYSVDPINRRSVSETGYCTYFNKNNNKSCAVGRCIDDVEYFIDKNIDYNHESAYNLINTFTTSIFKEQYQHLDNIEFWGKIQFLHDTNGFWNKEGLTNEGLVYKEEIINYIKTIQ